jgi:hypothetical protein
MVFIFGACEKDPSEPNAELEIDQVVSDHAPFGWEVNQMVSTGSEMEELTRSSNFLEEEGIGNITDVMTLKKQAQRVASLAYNDLPSKRYLMKPSTEDFTLVIDDTTLGVRVGIFYDSLTGKGRVYEVRYKFAPWRNIVYDSSEVVVDLNYTLDNDSDDMLESLFRLQQFKENFFVQSILSNLEVTDFENQEITGVLATSDSYYHDTRFLAHLRQSVEINPDHSGTLGELFDFRDGSDAYRTVTFYPNNTGDYEKKLRDGTMVNGEFNCVEDDLQGSFSETIDFPEGRYIDKIEKSAQISLTLPESIFNAEYSEMVYFSSGQSTYANIEIEVQEIEGVKKTTLEATKANGAHGTLVIEESDTQTTLEGEWYTWNDYYILVDAEYFMDGSGHIHYEVYQTPYNPGDTPILYADYYFSPDQSGNGILSYNGVEYQLTFDQFGQVQITQNGQSTNINLYQ